ncbi:MAG: TonB family protein [Pseudomonadota bacterium]
MKYLLILIAIFCMPFVAMAQTTAPDVTEVVQAHEAWEVDPKDREKRKAIGDALVSYNGEPTVETLNAHIALMTYSVQNDRPRILRETALAAATHIEPVADIVPQQHGQAAYIAAIALFNDRQSPEALLEMAELEGRMSVLRGDDGERPEFAEDLYWKSQAWRGAMEAYFVSAGRKRDLEDDKVEAILSKWQITDEQINERADLSEATGPKLPFCEGELVQSPKVKYPRGGARDGMFGSLFLRYSFDEAGRVTDPEVLASIPVEGFEEEVKKTVVKWKWKPAKPDNVGKTCRVSRKNIVQQFIFSLR